MATKFCDTSYLLNNPNVLQQEDYIWLSVVTLKELEDIKSSGKKSEDTKYKARQVVRAFNTYPMKYKIMNIDFDSSKSNDEWICISAHGVNQSVEPVTFMTDDLLLRFLAKEIYGLSVGESKYDIIDDKYTGYEEVILSDDEMASFYSYMSINNLGILTNQYVVIRNFQKEVVDLVRWDGNQFVTIKRPNLKTNMFGNIKPFNNDIYQQLAIDSMTNNQLTMLTGPSGTGKSHLALAHMFKLLENHKTDKIVIFCNTVATLDSARLGFYPGTRLEKILDSQLGTMLASKIGDKSGVERLVNEEKLEILPMSDIRGYDLNDGSCLYITEAQNTTTSLMKLAVQRIGENCPCAVIEGDFQTQLDSVNYSGSNNGMRRLSEVFRGKDFYGEVQLKNIYRSKIAQIAEKM